MINTIKIVAVVALMIGCYVGGYYSNNKPAVVEKQAVIVEKAVTKIVTVTKVAPDGTKTETVTEDKIEDKTAKVKEAQPVPVSAPSLPQYSVGLGWNPERFAGGEYSPTSIDLGYRLLGNAWAVAGYDWSTKEITTGIRMNF